jgi:uncharacterized Zn-finger protein
MIYKAKAFSGFNMSIFQLFGSGPKFQIKCGYCDFVFSARIQMVDNPRVRCSLCGAINELDIEVE